MFSCIGTGLLSILYVPPKVGVKAPLTSFGSVFACYGHGGHHSRRKIKWICYGFFAKQVCLQIKLLYFSMRSIISHFIYVVMNILSIFCIIH
jgi:hypothetical protein